MFLFSSQKVFLFFMVGVVFGASDLEKEGSFLSSLSLLSFLGQNQRSFGVSLVSLVFLTPF